MTSTGGSGGSGTAGNGGASAGAGTGGSAGGPGGAGGGQGADDRLLPLELGRRWTFQQTAIDATQPANCSRAESSVVSRASFGDQSGWTYAPTCSAQNADVLINGDDIAFYSSAAHLETERFDYATAPVQDGRIWTTVGNRFTWRDAGTVQTPAGRFDRCWQRNAMSADTYIILCRGTGLVVVNSPPSNYRLELMSKNF
jgi:hypothetical protein